MKNIPRYLVTLSVLLLGFPPSYAQEEELPVAVELTADEVQNISDEMADYVRELTTISSYVATASRSNLISQERHLESVQVRWNAYTSIQQVEITSSPLLMELMAQYQLLYNSVNDAISQRKQKLQAGEEFNDAVAYVSSQSKKYDGLCTQAQELSLLPQTAKELARLKAEEQLSFQEVTERYKKGIAAIEKDPSLKARKQELESAYVSIMLKDQEIQAAQYETLIQRFKDYIYSLAAVAVVLMFFNFLSARISTIKAARESAKKYADAINKSEYPTI